MSPTNGLQIYQEVSNLKKEKCGWLGSSQGSDLELLLSNHVY